MSCCQPETPAKRIDVNFPADDFWRSNAGAALPDGNNDHTEEVSHNGPIVVGALTGTAGKMATIAGDLDVFGQIDPNSIVFSDAPTGTLTAFDSATLGYYKIGVIGTQRVLVLMPKADVVDAVQTRKADGATVVTDTDTMNGRFSINTATPQAALDAHGDVIFGQILNLPNFAANAVLGTAAATVDLTSVIEIAQTTAGIALTLPPPTRTKAGRLLLILNSGSQPVSVDGNTIANGKLLLFAWDGFAWFAIAAGGGSSEDFFRSGTAAALVKPDGTTDFTDQISHNGNIGLGLADPSLVRARLDVSGSEILRPVALANFTANASIGTATATVDVASTISITQTTANIVLTLPAPTNTQAGRLLVVENLGTVSVTVGGVSIPALKHMWYVWGGAAWIPQVAGSTDDFFRSGTAAALLIPDGTNDFTEAISHNGNMGLGLADPATVSARLDVSGSQVLRPVTLANFAANAVIGTAAATVDVASIINIPQTTQGITVTVPAPTNAQSGRLLTIRNTGSAPFNVGSTAGNQKIWPGASATFTFNGTAWVPDKHAPYALPIAIGGNITLDPVLHHWEILEYNGGANITVTVPSSLPVGFQVSFTQVGAGRIIFAAGAGMVIGQRWLANQTAGTWAKAGLEVRAAGQSILSGDVV